LTLKQNVDFIFKITKKNLKEQKVLLINQQNELHHKQSDLHRLLRNQETMAQELKVQSKQVKETIMFLGHQEELMSDQMFNIEEISKLVSKLESRTIPKSS